MSTLPARLVQRVAPDGTLTSTGAHRSQVGRSDHDPVVGVFENV